MLFDIFSAYNGENSLEMDKKYRKLKAIAGIAKKNYEDGNITKKEYESYLNAIKDYESG